MILPGAVGSSLNKAMASGHIFYLLTLNKKYIVLTIKKKLNIKHIT